jgi:drug/metabolite transporter (DMT)-like permease
MTGTALVYVFAAALMASMLYVILRFFPKYKIYNLHALTINYFAAAGTSLIVNGIPDVTVNQFTTFLIPALVMGLLFIAVFYSAAISTQICGVGVTTIAAKMSMVIPITIAVFLFKDSMNAIKVCGIILALLAVYLTSSVSEKSTVRSKFWFLPLLVFVGSGTVDISIKIIQHFYFTDATSQLYISMLFASAGCIGIIISIYNFQKNKIPFSMQSLIGGSILGIVNYYSLDFLVKCLALKGVESSLVFSLINLLVVVLSAIIAFILFNERPDRKRLAGLSLAIVAIVILYI